MLSMIILAAGKSSRMRGKNKLLSEIDGKPMIRRVVEAALNSKVDEVLVVLGWKAERVRKVLGDLPCRFVLNKEYEKGQSSSVRAALSAVGDPTQAILVLPGDVALIDQRSINLVIEAYNNHGSPIVVASHKGIHGHPILLSRETFEDIARIDEATYGLKSVVQKHQNEIQVVEVGTEDILLDVDTPEDLQRIRKPRGKHGSRGRSSARGAVQRRRT